jgi:hypothetical protein
MLIYKMAQFTFLFESGSSGGIFDKDVALVIGFFVIEAFLILLNLLLIWKLIQYIRVTKSGGQKATIDSYLVISTITLSFSMMLRSAINIVVYLYQLKYYEFMSPGEDFNHWLKVNSPRIYVTIEIIYLVVLAIRNTSLLFNLTRWSMIKHGMD